MPATNVVILAGRLTRDPEVKYTGAGRAYCHLAMANEERWKGKDGEIKKSVLYIDVILWDKLAEYIGEKLRKGRPVQVEGRLIMDEWEDRETQKKRRAIKLHGKNVTILDWADSERQPREEKQDRGGGQSQGPVEEDGPTEYQDDIPF